MNWPNDLFCNFDKMCCGGWCIPQCNVLKKLFKHISWLVIWSNWQKDQMFKMACYHTIPAVCRVFENELRCAPYKSNNKKAKKSALKINIYKNKKR